MLDEGEAFSQKILKKLELETDAGMQKLSSRNLSDRSKKDKSCDRLPLVENPAIKKKREPKLPDTVRNIRIQLPD